MKLLQIPTATLDQRIKEELESNPALEEGEDYDSDSIQEDPFEEATGEDDSLDFELDDYIEEYIEEDPSSYRYEDNNFADDEDRSRPMEVRESYRDYLEMQLGIADIHSPDDYTIALHVIGSIDEDGYLRRDTSSIVDDLMFTQNMFVEESKVIEILAEIQKFDPAGTGSRDLRECLLIQIQRKLTTQAGEQEDLRLAEKIVRDYFNEFSKKHFDKLKRALDVEDDELSGAMSEILRLNPKPSSGYSNGLDSADYVLPDFSISNRDGELDVVINSRNAPDLKINDYYKNMLQGYQANFKRGDVSKKEKETVLFIKQKIDSAKWFIDAIVQRQQTMYKTMFAILSFQEEYFRTGDERTLKPMILKDISDLTGLDISTISRVANSKYVQTEFGTKKLKEFFSEAVQNKDGEDVSTLEVKQILQDLVDQEDKRKPLSDENLKKELDNKGYTIARRTIAKYREQLGISVARLRKHM